MENFEFQDSIKSKRRVRDLGEVFTPSNIVNDMLDMDEIRAESYRIESKFLEPACGNGNFLVEILKRKLKTVRDSCEELDDINYGVVLGISNIYGVDIMSDNIKEAKERMILITKNFYMEQGLGELPENIKQTVIYLLDRNIILGDTITNKMADLKTTLRARQGRKITFNNDLEVNEWTFNGRNVTRHTFRFSNMDIEMNIKYPEIPYDMLYKLKDKLEEEDYIL